MRRGTAKLSRAATLVAIAGCCAAIVGCAGKDGAVDASATKDVARRPGLLGGRLPASGLQTDRDGAVRSPDFALSGGASARAERERVEPVDIVLPGVTRRPGADAPVGIDVPVQRDLDVTLNFKAAPLQEVVREIFENVLHLDYAISPKVADTAMSFVLEGRVGYEELFRTLDAVLGMYDASLQVSNGLVQVLPNDEAKRGVGGPLVRSIDPETNTPLTLATYVIPLTSIKAEDAATTLKDLLTPRGSIIKGPAGTGVVLLVESPANAPRLAQLLRELDQPFFARRSVRLYTPTHLTAEELAGELNAHATRLGLRTSGGEDAQFAAAALQRSNQVLVTTTLPAMLAEMNAHAQRVDVQVDAETRRRYVYRAQRLDADTLQQAVMSAFADLPESDAPRITVVSGDGASGGLSSIGDVSTTAATTGDRTRTSSQRETSRSGASTTGTTRTSIGGSRSTLDQGILIINAKPDVYAQVKELLEVLDAPPRQVYLQIVIAEVTITGDVQFGIELFTQQSIDDYDVELRTANNLVDAATGSIFALGKNAFALVEAAQTQGDVRVLDAPYVFTLSGNTANLEVGVDQPVITQFISGGVDAVDPTRQSNQIEYRQTGIVLSVTPKVNDRGEIEIDLRQEVSSVDQPAASAVIQSPAFPNRILQTKIVVPNGGTAVLGGTRSERDSLQRSKTPLLADIPLIGLAFQGKDVRRTQSELVILITPTIVVRPGDAIDMSRQVLGSIVNLDLIDDLLEAEKIDEGELLWR
jgi:general secretion pathway protein D